MNYANYSILVGNTLFRLYNYRELASSPGRLRRRRRKGLVHTVCAWSVTLRILEDRILVYFLVYLPFDLYSTCFREERMAGLDRSIFERNFETAVAMLIGDGI